MTLTVENNETRYALRRKRFDELSRILEDVGCVLFDNVKAPLGRFGTETEVTRDYGFPKVDTKLERSETRHIGERPTNIESRWYSTSSPVEKRATIHGDLTNGVLFSRAYITITNRYNLPYNPRIEEILKGKEVK